MDGLWHTLSLPPGLPPDRVWVPASTPAEARSALDALYQAISDSPVPHPRPEQDRC